ncbi:CidA/LrgA family protein [Agaribacterium haliotis]|uniref:CidA/LrgA family protein n=1 Tax=Agaribacterium haliotis TaxID=2013869 RepID=UPI000BB544D8|nr:CidA/LrgA family protein [Agaribacterium haliotis]
MFKKLRAFIYAAFGIALSLACGHLLASVLGLLPASLWGMLIFSAYLALPVVPSKKLGSAIDVAMVYMPLVFLPICVGLVQYGDIVSRLGWKILLIGASSTLLLIVVLGMISQRLLIRDVLPDGAEDD